MSKNLRVFFLSVLVVVLGVSSAFGALTEYTLVYDTTAADGTANATDSDGNIVATFSPAGIINPGNELVIYANGQFTFEDGYGAKANAVFPNGVVIDNITLDGNATGDVSEAVFVIPTPYPTDAAAQGTTGQWNIHWPATVKNSSGVARILHAADQDVRVKFTLSKRSTNSAIIATALLNFTTAHAEVTESTGGIDFVLNAPIRVNQNRAAQDVTVTVGDGDTITFDREAEIFWSQSIQNYPTGYITTATPNVATYNIGLGGELIIRNTWALRGSALTVNGANALGVVAKGKRPTLTVDLPAGTVHDLRGRIAAGSTSSALENTNGHINADSFANPVAADPNAASAPFTLRGGAILNLTGPTVFKVVNDMTLYGQIDPGAVNTVYNLPAYANLFLVTKAGAGKLTLANDSSVPSDATRNLFERRSIPSKIHRVLVEEGTLEFASQQTWRAGLNLNAGDTPTVVVSTGATFIAGKKSIEEDTYTTAGVNPVAFTVNGTAIFKDHAIVKRDWISAQNTGPLNEIYPYEDYVTFNNGLTINALDTRLNVPAGGKVIIDEGSFAAGTITGKGDIEIRNTTDPSKDKAVLILTSSTGRDTSVNPPVNWTINQNDYAHNYIDFQGKIYGAGGNAAGANVGLYSSQATNEPYSRRIFRSADVKIENLIVYGPAQLNVDANTNLEGVESIWLRGHRPGADNTKTATAYSKLNVGELNFVPGTKNTDIIIKSLKVDGTSSTLDMGSVNILNYDNDSVNEAAYVPGLGVVGQAPRYYDAAGNRGTSTTLGPRINAYISSLQLYANKGANKDFTTDYVLESDAKGIYALTINGAEQPSRIIIDGTNVTGDGRAEDVTNKIYQVIITGKSDVKFTGNGDWTTYSEYYPLAHSNSLLVKQDAKLEIVRGGIIDGHLAFEPSSLTNVGGAWPEFGPHYLTVNGAAQVIPYPVDSDFYDYDGWYIGDTAIAEGLTIDGVVVPFAYLNDFTTFSTQVGPRNRRTNDGGEYAVQVTGDLTLSDDNGAGYADGSGRVLVRAKPDLNAYDAYEFTTIGQRFKVLGTATGEYTEGFATSYNGTFQFRIPSDKADTTGVTVENRTELAIVTLGDWSFMAGGEEFGMGAGHNFSIKVPFTVTVRGEKVTITRELDKNNNIRYALGIGAEKWYFGIVPIFLDYADGEEITVDDVIDANRNDTLVRDDITLRAEVDITDGEQYVRIIGTSYTGEDPAKVQFALRIFADDDLARGLGANVVNGTYSSVDWLDGSIPGFRSYMFVREGITPPDAESVYSSAATTHAAGDEVDVVMGTTESVKFTITGIRKATYENAAMPRLVDGKYVWDNGADTGTYYMLDATGKEAKVTNLTVRRFNGDYLKKDTTPTEVADNFTIEVNGNVATVTVPATELGDTGGAFSAIKGLSIVGQRADGTGEIVTVPVNYTLHTAVEEADTVTLETKVATVDSPAELRNDINDLEGVIKFIRYDEIPSWLGYTEYDGGFGYNTGDLTGVAPGTYTFRVLAYTGDNALASPHKLYTFAVSVGGGDVPTPAISGSASVTVLTTDAAKTETFTLVGGATGDFAVQDSINPAGLLTITADGVATINPAGVAAGTYSYVITAGTLTHEFTVTVSTPAPTTLEVELDDSNASMIEGYNYKATLTASNASGEVTWTLGSAAPAWLKLTKTGATTAVLEGLVPAYVEDYDDDDPNEITFTVTAADADGATADVEVSISVEEDSSAMSATIPNVTVTPAAGVEAATVKADYSVEINFPVDEDGVPTITVDDLESINLPSWLTYEPKTNADDEVTGLVLKYNAVDGVAQGTRGSVRIPVSGADDYDVLGWDVVYDVPAPALEFTLGKTSMNLRVGSSDTVALTATNAQGTVNYTYTAAPATGLTVSIAEGVATVTAATAGSYTVTFTATDERGAEAAKTAALNVTVTTTPEPGPGPNPPFGVTATPTTLNVVAGSTATVTLAASNAQGTVSYTANQTWVTFSGNTATFAPTTAGTYTVTVTATDAGRTTGNTATATVTVTVTDGGTPTPVESEDFALTTTRSVSLNLATLGGNTSTITLAPANALGAVSYTYTVTPSTGLTVSISGNTATLTAEETGTYTVVFTATDAGRTTGNTATFTTTVTVGSGIVSPDVRSIGSSGGGCDAGFGALALVLAAPLFLRRRRS